ncbi:hypothetical protein AYM40_03420 [Paraburkholderia phytofirmans OLGA172]|uniref:Glycosyl hydrolase family 71 n=1 Tax=Paraburkholderia phytofirmans OLGA172 TaxID=1417228 RepID=A0A160FHB0_9BURK|nr:hypothetical protein AYM40_03420 [Paraburkholderia phytofirmans OLGA172]
MRTVKWILPVLTMCFSALPLTAQCEESVQTLAPPNTSASLTFAGTSNGNLGGSTSVSNVNIHTLLYPGHTTKVLAHYLPWWADPASRRVSVGYRSDDPAQALRTFKDMQARGVDGVIVDWYGQTDTHGGQPDTRDQPEPIDVAWRKSMPELAKFPDLSFSIMVDSGTYSFNRCKDCDVTQTVLSQLDYISRTYFSSRQYLRYNGHPVVFEFGMDWSGKVDWSRIQAAHPEISWIHIHKQGFDRDYSAGAFVWVTAGPAAHKVSVANLSQLKEFYRYARTEPAKIATGGVFKGFDDDLASWAKPKEKQYMPQACGNTWLQTFDLINQNYSATRQLPFLQLITWNDYEEGTALEPGIDNCVTLQTHLSGNALAVKLSHAATVDHLELYESLAGGGFRLMNRYAPATAVIALPASASGTLYLKAVGKPFFRNVLSSPIMVGRSE